MTKMSPGQLLELRRQFQDALFDSEKLLLEGVKVALTVIVALLSVQSGFMLWALQNASNDFSLVLILAIIPIGIIFVSIIGLYNLKREYRNELEYITCLAKVEDEIDFTRTKKISFKCEDSILCKRWLEDREKYDTTKEFKNDLLKIRLTSYGMIKLLYLLIIGVAVGIIILSVYLFA